jgi:hypothetical protein
MFMTDSRIGRIAIVFGCALILPAFAASNIVFTVPGAFRTQPYTINNNGDVAGCYYPTDGSSCEAFVRTSDGTITTFAPPGAVNTFIGNINDSGAIAGTYIVIGDQGYYVSHGFVRSSSGVITTFDPPGASGTDTAFINDSGTIGGSYGGTGYIESPDGTFTTFTGPDNSLGYVAGINSNGDVGGSGGKGLFVRTSDGTYYTISHNLGNYPGFVNGINASDEVVGTSETQGENPFYVLTVPFVWTNGSRVEDFAPGLATSAFGINDNGDVVGGLGLTGEGFLRSSAGQISVFNVGGESTAAYAINNSGVITGKSGNSGFVQLP